MDAPNQNASHHDAFIEYLEKYKLLTGSIPVSLFISTCLAVIMATVLYGQVAYTSLISWLVILVSIHIIRLLVFYQFNRSSNFDRQQINLHLRFFRFGTLMSALVWGWAGFFFSQQVELSYQIFITFTLGGLVVGATSSLATDRLSVVSFIMVTILPNCLHYFIAGNELPMAMGLMLMLFAGFMLNTGRLQGSNLHENLNLRIKARQDASQFREVLNFSPVAVSIFSLDDNQMLYINRRYLELFSRSFKPFEVNNESGFAIEASQLDSIKARLLRNQTVSNLLFKVTSKQTQEVKWCIGSFLQVTYLNTPSILAWFYDISDRIEMEQQIRHLAYHDSLTDLPNRYLFEDRLNLALKYAKRNQRQLGVLFIDLDGFKAVNDTYGHDIGDMLLKAVSARIASLLRVSDTLSRVGGDEFIVLLPEIADSDDGLHVAGKLLDALAEPFDIAEQSLLVSASIGLAMFPEHGEDDQTLLKKADIAMYEAKKDGKNAVRVFQTQA
jgi:diguanylate cyclase (GGDEF)-like protein